MNSSSVRTAANFALWLIFSIVSSVSGCPPASTESEMSKKPGIELKVNCDIRTSGSGKWLVASACPLPLATSHWFSKNRIARRAVRIQAAGRSERHKHVRLALGRCRQRVDWDIQRQGRDLKGPGQAHEPRIEQLELYVALGVVRLA